MATRNLVPRNSGEGGVGRPTKAWATGVFDNLYISGLSISMDQNVRTSDNVEFISGNFTEGLTLKGVDVATSVESIQQTLEEAAPFLFFFDAQDNNGITQKTFFDTPVENKYLSGISVAAATGVNIKLRWDGPNDEYVGEAKINGQVIPKDNISELGTDTRRFEGFIDGLNLVGLTGITGEANGRETVISLTELGLGPEPSNIYIDSIENVTPKNGELAGTTHLKEGDSINIYVDFNRDDIDLIKVHDLGVAKEIDFTNYSLQDIDGVFRATIPITVSNREGSHAVGIQAIDTFGSTGQLILSSSFGHTSGTRDLDQKYPNILASNPISYNGRLDGLREAENTTFTNNISNWSSSTDTITYTALDSNISIDNPNDFQNLKTVNYEQGIFSNSENIEIYTIRSSNGATDKERVTVNIANGPVIVSTQMNSLASSSVSPHIIGTDEVKAGDIVDSKIEVDGNGVGINDISIQVLNQGISDGVSYTSNYTKSTLENGNFEFLIPLEVCGSLGSAMCDGVHGATFKARNNFGTESDQVTTTDTATVHNVTRPSISIGDVVYPNSQRAIKNTESAELNNVVVEQDIIVYSSPNNQLLINEPNTFDTEKLVTYQNGDYNIDTDGGQSNIKITATKTSNGAVTESYKVVNIANKPLELTISNLETKLKSPSSDSFSLISDQQMLSIPVLSLDANQTDQPSLTQSSSGLGKSNNSYSISVQDSNTKGTFSWGVSATNLAGIETTIITNNPNYTLEGFESRTVVASPNSLGAGLAPIGTTVTNPNNITFENVSEGGTAPNGGTFYTYENISEGTQLNNSFNFDNKFTICNDQGIVSNTGDHVFNLDQLNRAANSSTSNPATYIISE